MATAHILFSHIQSLSLHLCTCFELFSWGLTSIWHKSQHRAPFLPLCPCWWLVTSKTSMCCVLVLVYAVFSSRGWHCCLVIVVVVLLFCCLVSSDVLCLYLFLKMPRKWKKKKEVQNNCAVTTQLFGQILVLKNIMMSQWSWPLTFWIYNVITLSFYPFGHLSTCQVKLYCIFFTVLIIWIID